MPEVEELANGETLLQSTSGDAKLLDNPIWNALNTKHSAVAVGGALAKRYPAEIGPLSGMSEPSAAAYGALRTLTNSGGIVALFLESPDEARPGWSLVRQGLLSQMIWSGRNELDSSPLSGEVKLRRLTNAEVPAMMALAELTEPGPFGRRTIELGEFFGIFESGRLLAMAGSRLQLPGFREISAVCTHPDARGRGFARTLMSEVIVGMLRRGETPFLHSFADNYQAIRVYERIGFVHRRNLHLAVLKRV